MNGIHPRFAKCKLVSIKFDDALGAWAELIGEHGEPLVVTASGVFVGDTLREIRRLQAPGLRLVKGGESLEHPLRVSVEAARALRGAKR